MTPTNRSRGIVSRVVLCTLAATACGGRAAPETAPEPAAAAAPAVVAEAGDARASVCAPSGLITENMRTRFGDLFTASDTVSVRRRRGMKIARLRSAPVSTVTDDRVCVRAVRSLAGREPAAARALGDAPTAAANETQGMARAGGSAARRGSRRPAAAGRAATSATRPVRPAPGGVLAIVKVGRYYLVQDAMPRPNAGSAPTYVLDAAMRLKGVIR